MGATSSHETSLPAHLPAREGDHRRDSYFGLDLGYLARKGGRASQLWEQRNGWLGSECPGPTRPSRKPQHFSFLLEAQLCRPYMFLDPSQAISHLLEEERNTAGGEGGAPPSPSSRIRGRAPAPEQPSQKEAPGDHGGKHLGPQQKVKGQWEIQPKVRGLSSPPRLGGRLSALGPPGRRVAQDCHLVAPTRRTGRDSRTCQPPLHSQSTAGFWPW